MEPHIVEHKRQALVEKRIILPKKPVIIGITGTNNTDGIGDLIHIINVGKLLEREGITKVIYRINFLLVAHENPKLSLELNPINFKRLSQLVKILEEYKIIPKIESLSKAKSINEVINNINKVNPEKFSILNLSEPLVCSSEDFWINVSYGDFEGVIIPKSVRKIYLMEHESPFLDLGIPNLYRFGIPQEGKKTVGLILNDHISKSQAQSKFSLETIINKNFNKLLKHDLSPLQKESDNLLQATEFIVCYPQHIKAIGASNLIVTTCAASARINPEKSQFFVKLGGNFDFNHLLTELNQSTLRANGITEIQYLEDEQIVIIELVKPAPITKKPLKLLKNCWLSEKENSAFKVLIGHLSICSGDNSLQDALSSKAIPILIPHTPPKLFIFTDLAEHIQRLGKKETDFSASFEFCTALSNIDKRSIIFRKTEEPLKNIVVKHVNFQLKTEWPKFCEHIIMHYNFSKVLRNYVSKLAQHDNIEESPAMLLIESLNLAFKGSSQINELFSILYDSLDLPLPLLELIGEYVDSDSYICF